MQEKNITMEDAFQVWWAIFWKTTLTAIGLALIFGILTKLVGVNEAVSKLLNMLIVIISILAQVFFVKSAINKNYKNFRLSATVSDNTQPQSYGK